jgi:hypothetical protein
MRAEALAAAQSLRRGAGAAAATGEIETQLKTERAALDQLREDRSSARARWPSCAPIWSILRQAA